MGNITIGISDEYDLLKPTYILSIGKRYRVSTILEQIKQYNFTSDLRSFVDLGYINENTILKFGNCCSEGSCRHMILCSPKIWIYKLEDGSFNFCVHDYSTREDNPSEVS